MQKRNVELYTRPFQSFFLGADDLLELAKPIYDKIEENSVHYKTTGKMVPLPRNIWRQEKSLSMGSFMLKYSGLEAFVNCIHHDFMVRKAKSFKDEYFVSLLSKKSKKFIKKKYRDWHLGTRVFFIVPLCSIPEVDPRTVFDHSDIEWEEFMELIQIRHSFNHAVSATNKFTMTKGDSNVIIGDDEHPDNFWPITKANRDNRVFNYEIANKLNNRIDWIVEKLRIALPTQLTDSYMTQEKGKYIDN